MTPKEIKAEFGQVIIASYMLSEIIVLGRLADDLAELITIYKQLGIKYEC